jgi:hypothetical protein
MDPRDDDDIQFDFFEDEAATTEAQPSRVRLPRRGGRGTGMRRTPAGPSRPLTPILRLLGAVVVLVVLLVVFGLLIQSCASESKHDTYANYLSDVSKIAHGSQDDGSAVANALTSGAKPAAMAGTLSGIADQERQNAAQAERLDPPGPLRDENQQLVETLQLRISGVSGLAKAFSQLASAPSSGDASVLAALGDRLVASDVVWSDLFKARTVAELQRQKVTDVEPPDSTFVQNRQLFTENSLTLLLQRLKGTSSTGKVTGLHGTGLVEVKANPGGTVLSAGSENTVTATTNLNFVATVKDTGNFQEVGIQVTMTLQKDSGGRAIVQTKKINLINPNQEKTVTFSGINVSGYFAVKSHLSIDVKAVSGETRLDNNKASYPVIFSLG